jgi:hypothetical protein
MIEDTMRKNIGKKFEWNNKHVKIINSFSCYDGDFYEYAVEGETEVHKVNIWSDTGRSFVQGIPN